MRGRFPAKAATAFAMLIVLTTAALAQFSPNRDFTPGLFGLAMDPRDKIIIDVAAAVLGFVVGAIFSPLLKPIRRIAFFTLLGLAVLFSWVVRSAGADLIANVVAVFAFFVTFGYGIRLGAAAALRRRWATERPTSFGSAKWATADYLQSKGLFDGDGFLLGEFHEDNARRRLLYDGARHLLTVAPTRSGKGVSSIVPNLLRYEGSALVIDPKGENALITALRRGRGDAAHGVPGLGQAVHLIDPWNIAAGQLGLKPARFNPLEWVKADDPDAAENAFLLADALVADEGVGEAKFWGAESKALLTGVILYVATSKNEEGRRQKYAERDQRQESFP